MRKTPQIIRIYLLLAVFFVALPTIGTKFYHGQTGRFMVASESIRYEPFRESVIYITHHNLFGAYGFVINKPIDVEKLREVYPDLPEGNLLNLKLGGPVGLYDEAFAIFSDHVNEPLIEWDEDKKLSLEQILNKVKNYPQKVVFIGYSGWGPLQLEMEIIRGTWSTVEVPRDIIFEENDIFNIWRELKTLRTKDRYEDQKI